MEGWSVVEVLMVALGTLLFLAMCAYVIARAVSIAHFRTKLEYFRSLLRQGENRNGS